MNSPNGLMMNEFFLGQPRKKNKSDVLDQKAFRLGFQTSQLAMERKEAERVNAEAQQALAALQQMMAQMQSQQAPPPQDPGLGAMTAPPPGAQPPMM